MFAGGLLELLEVALGVCFRLFLQLEVGSSMLVRCVFMVHG